MDQFEILKYAALSFPETTEAPHFEKISFKVKKKIFATYTAKQNQACLKLSEVDQDVFSAMGKEAIYAVPNKWGAKGWTFIELDKISNELLVDALKAAYICVAPRKLGKEIK